MAKLSHKITENDDIPTTFAPIPNGWYSCTIDSAELVNNKNGSGTHHKFQLTLTGPTHIGAKLFPTFTETHDNGKAVEIGRRQLARLAVSCGIKELDDTDQLIGKACEVKVGLRKSNDPRYEDSSEAKDFRPAGSGKGKLGAAAQPAAEWNPKMLF